MFFLLPLIGVAVGATIAVVDAANESDRQAAKHHRRIENKLTEKYSNLQKQYNEFADKSKELIKEQNKKLSLLGLENSYLDIALELTCSLFLLSQDIDRNPTHKSLTQLREAIRETNQVLSKLSKQCIPISEDYFTRNFASIAERAKREWISSMLEGSNKLSRHQERIATRIYELKQEIESLKHLTKNIPEYLESEIFNLTQELSNILQEKDVPVLLIEQLSCDKEILIRLMVASSPNTPVNVLKKLACDCDYWVREAVAKNPSSPEYLIENFIKGLSNDARMEYARSSETPRRILEKLSYDSDSMVREISLENPSLLACQLTGNSVTMAEKVYPSSCENSTIFSAWFGIDKNSTVLSEYQQLIVKQIYELVDLVKRNHHISNDVVADSLREIAKRLKEDDVPIFVFDKLSCEKFSIRAVVAGCPRSPIYLLEKLSCDLESFVRKTVAENPMTPSSTLIKLVSTGNLDIDLRKANISFRKELASTTTVAPDILAELAQDKSSDVREIVASHPNTPHHVLKKLARSQHIGTRLAAQTALVSRKPT